jgi:hypothetical protein
MPQLARRSDRFSTRSRANSALVLAFVALLVATTASSYAAVKLARNSVGTAQLKNNAVTGVKVRDGSLLSSDFKAGQLPEGAQGPVGPQGAQGPVGPQGAQGERGAPGTLLAYVSEPDDDASWQTREFTLPAAPSGSYVVSYSISVSATAGFQPDGTQFYCSAREGGVPPLRGKSTSSFVPDAAFASGHWSFTGDPAGWSIRCALWVPQPDPMVVKFPSDVTLADAFPSEIILQPVTLVP